jgi:integrase
MAGITFVLREPNAKTPQKIICIVRVGSSDRSKLSTKFSVNNPKNWNAEKCRVKDVIAEKDKTTINKALQSIEEEFNRIMLRMTADKKAVNSAFLKSQLEEFLKPQQPETVPVHKETPTQELLRLIEQYVTDSENGTRKNHDGEKLAFRSIQRYRTVQTRLVEFSKIYDRELSLITIDEIFHNDYVQWLEVAKNLAKNTIWKDVTTIKSIMNYFLEEGLIKALPYRTKKFKAVEEESDNVYLTMAELENIENLDLSNNQRLERVRDFFIVGCYTGFRYSDLSKVNKYSFLKEEDSTEFIQLVQQKTGEPITVPVLHVVKEIFEKYDYQLPSISNQKVNDYIKEVCQMAEINETVSKSITKGGKKITTNYEKWQLVTDHTARRSFATNAYKRGVSTLVIMAITGHKTEKSFMKYIKLDNMEKAKRFKSDWLKSSTDKELPKNNIKVLTA